VKGDETYSPLHRSHASSHLVLQRIFDVAAEFSTIFPPLLFVGLQLLNIIPSLCSVTDDLGAILADFTYVLGDFVFACAVSDITPEFAAISAQFPAITADLSVVPAHFSAPLPDVATVLADFFPIGAQFMFFSWRNSAFGKERRMRTYDRCRQKAGCP
jgi:hypothetical protein